MRQEYEVRLELFEGPLDLLLYLVNKSEINIADIQVSQIAAQYLEYLDVMRELNIDIASEYLHMASILIRLKARELLPPLENEALMQEEDGIYNREQLIAQLLEYKKYREAATTLKVFESEQFGAFRRGVPEEVEAGKDDEVYLGNISIFDLLTAFKKVLERAKTEDPGRVLTVDNVKIDDRIEWVLMLLADEEEVPFEKLFEGDLRRIVIAVTFMAILELIKIQEIYFRQEKAFGSIFVKMRREKEPLLPGMVAESSPDWTDNAGKESSGEAGKGTEGDDAAQETK
jgi:segregation and condensation protein A